LKNGNTVIDLNQDYELEQLRAKLESLNLKYQFLVNEISTLNMSEEYKTIISIDDWNEYFEAQKESLKAELNSIESKYYKDEQTS
jgi:hypothetical protein